MILLTCVRGLTYAPLPVVVRDLNRGTAYLWCSRPSHLLHLNPVWRVMCSSILPCWYDFICVHLGCELLMAVQHGLFACALPVVLHAMTQLSLLQCAQVWYEGSCAASCCFICVWLCHAMMTVQHYLYAYALHAVLHAIIQLSLLQCCLSHMDSHVQQHVALLMWLQLLSAVPCNVDDNAAWSVRYQCR